MNLHEMLYDSCKVFMVVVKKVWVEKTDTRPTVVWYKYSYLYTEADSYQRAQAKYTATSAHDNHFDYKYLYR